MRFLASPCVAARIVILCAASAHAVAHAQQAPQPSPTPATTEQKGLGDIVVTASRREEKLQKVGISITALSASALQQMGVKQTSDIVSQVPSLRLNQYNSASPVFNIRGVSQNSFDDQLEPPVAIYVDDAYIAAAGAQSVPSFDLARVEVLRGPQGTLFGRNATGGLIQFISKRPTKTLDGYLDVTGGTNGHANVEGAISGPLTDDIQARIAGAYNYRRPFIRNLIGTGGQGLNNYALRGQLAAQPTDRLNLLVIGRFSRNDNEKQGTPAGVPAYPDADGLGLYVGPNQNPWGTCNGCDAYGWKDTDGNPYVVSADTSGRFNRTIYGAQGRVEWDLGGVQVTSITDWLRNHRTSYSDDDGSPNPIFDDFYYQRYHQISEEFRLSGSTSNLRWTTGFYYLDTHSDNGFQLTSFGDYMSGYNGKFRTHSWSIFGQGEYDITSKLTVIGGLRYVQDRKTADVVSQEHFDGALTAQLIFNPSTYPDLAREKFNDYAARAQVNYKLDEDVLLYASFNRGIKGPNFIAQSFTPFIPENSPHKGETLLAYEAGLKGSFFDRTVRLNIDGFVYDHHNYQAYSYKNLVSAIVNKPATAKGIEAELTLAPILGLTLSSGVSLMESKVKDVVLPSGRIITSNLPQSPGLSGNVSVNYEVPVSDGLKASAHFDMAWTRKFNFSIFPAEVTEEPGHAEGNLRLSLSDAKDRWTASVFCHNLWKVLYRTYALDSSGYGSLANIYNEPRWFGLELRYNLGQH
jgi:iron complex outermembrane receptor protein